MEGTGRFTASNWSKTDPPRFSDCRLVVLYKGMKTCGGKFLVSDFGDFLAILETKPAELWANGYYGWIQQVRKVQK
jgi:hypothetical protein